MTHTADQQTDIELTNKAVALWAGFTLEPGADPDGVYWVWRSPDKSDIWMGESAPKFNKDARAFLALLTVLAESGYLPRVEYMMTTTDGVTAEWVADLSTELVEQDYGTFTAIEATPQLALLAATTKLIESVSSNQEKTA